MLREAKSPNGDRQTDTGTEGGTSGAAKEARGRGYPQGCAVVTVDGFTGYRADEESPDDSRSDTNPRTNQRTLSRRPVANPKSIDL